MGPLTEHHIVLFLIQFAIVLGLCKLVGYVFDRFKLSPVVAEVLIGLLLGTAVLGKIALGLHNQLFPDEPIQRSLLDIMAWFGNFFLLMETGLEINFSKVWKQRDNALKLSVSDIIIPIIVAFIPIYFLPSHYLIDPDKRLIFSFFIGSILTISALPVAIRAMGDMKILKSDTGFLIVSSLAINDLFGWTIFTILMGLFAQSSVQVGAILSLLSYTLIFIVFSLTLLRRIVDKIITFIHTKVGEDTGYKLTFITIFGMLMGATTALIGIHSLFGFFIAGIVVGETTHFSENDRQVIKRMVHSIFVPIFFANIGLHLDFVSHFDWKLVAFISVIGIAARYVGAYVGSIWAKQQRNSWDLISICHTPGGEMHIVVAMIAFSAGLITEVLFVSIVAASIISTIVFGPWLSISLKKLKKDLLNVIFSPESVLLDTMYQSKSELLEALSQIVASKTGVEDSRVLQEIMRREESMTTAIGKGIAFPHARLDGINNPMILFARSKHGLEWDSPDGKPVYLIFLIITQQADEKAQLQLLRALANGLQTKNMLESLKLSADRQELWNTIKSEIQSCEQCLTPQ